MPSDALRGVALVTGGGRGIGASIARELSDAGMRVAVTGRSSEQVHAVADELDGLALLGDATDRDDVEGWVEQTERELGPIDLLVANAGVAGSGHPFLEESIEEWWRVFEVNVLGAYLCCRTVGARMAERGHGRIVNIGSGGSYLPIANPTISLGTSYGPSKAALGRFTEILAAALGQSGVRVFLISPGLVRTSMTERMGDNAPWTPPELAPRLVRVLASGRADALTGRYLHAEHDDIEDLIARSGEIAANDLNAIRLRR
ncbi:MAG: SDR family oxidoreductase [Thermoleophilia bacterium]|nr:SDR family oxidoreductase [Thermoleophilia bacterium]MDH4339698.1 SDR family oxidoreductase [Thermoleophilia bacterium]MDH5280789.1 SDR family oxidoreductase [Thermoleophilia bacterium]